MYVRMTTFDGVEAGRIDELVEFVGQQTGPPPGVPSTRLLLLGDPAEGKVVFVGFFATKEDLETGDAALRAMDPPVPLSDNWSVQKLEVLAEMSADG
jgi:hypothetical protein